MEWRRGIRAGPGTLLRTLKEKLRLERLRWLWMQCDMFDAREESPTPTPQPNVRTRVRGDVLADAPSGTQRIPRTHREDVAFVETLKQAHTEYNERLFGGQLRSVQIRISRRMKNRLGHYMAACNGVGAEIAMSRKHIERDPWDDVLHTFVHEMVHQWQDEEGRALDHGQSFRRKAREVGISARATRPAAPTSHQSRLAARAMHRPKP